MSEQLKLHVWVDVRGDAGTPPRFWKRTFYTDQEYQNLDLQTQSQCRKIKGSDTTYLSSKKKELIKIGD